MVTGNNDESGPAVAAGSGVAAPANGVATGIDMDSSVQDEGVALPENSLLAGIILASLLGCPQCTGCPDW